MYQVHKRACTFKNRCVCQAPVHVYYTHICTIVHGGQKIKIFLPSKRRANPLDFLFLRETQGVREWAKNLRSLLPFHFLGRSSIILYIDSRQQEIDDVYCQRRSLCSLTGKKYVHRKGAQEL
jgi:hypothetical protein